jgi:hypothetical protein
MVHVWQLSEEPAASMMMTMIITTTTYNDDDGSRGCVIIVIVHVTDYMASQDGYLQKTFDCELRGSHSGVVEG